MKTPIKPITCVLIGLTALAGCGGGGGGGGGGDTIAMVLDANNAETVAADVYATVDFTSSLGDLGTDLPTGAVVETAGSRLDLVGFAIEQYRRARATEIPAQATGATMQLTLDASDGVCLDGGNMNLSFTDANDNEEFDAGDAFGTTYNDCADNGSTVDGGFSAQIRTVAGDPDSVNWSIGLTVSFEDLSFNDADFAGNINGGFSLDFEMDGDTTIAVIAGDTLALNGVHAVTLSDFTMQITRTLDEYVYDASGAVAFDGQSVSYATTTPFTGIPENYPHSGALRIVGANNGSVTLTAVDDTNVQVAVDANGDGSTDQTIETTWAALGT